MGRAGNKRVKIQCFSNDSITAAPAWSLMRECQTTLDRREKKHLHYTWELLEELKIILFWPGAESCTASIFSRKMSWCGSDLERIRWNYRQSDKSSWRSLYARSALCCYFVSTKKTFLETFTCYDQKTSVDKNCNKGGKHRICSFNI